LKPPLRTSIESEHAQQKMFSHRFSGFRATSRSVQSVLAHSGQAGKGKLGVQPRKQPVPTQLFQQAWRQSTPLQTGNASSRQVRCFGRMTGIPSGRDAEEDHYEGWSAPHFRKGRGVEHPIVDRQAPSMERTQTIKKGVKPTYDEHTWSLPAVNHLWTPEEVKFSIENQHAYKPKTMGDKAIRFLVKSVMYRGFNWVSGFDYTDPTPRSCAFRLIILESIAGIPGMVAGMVRHLESLRTLRRDNGWIHTLCEEAQNERMHLMVCLKMFDTGLMTRMSVVVAQTVIVPFMFGVYLVHPKSLHRFVGYLEETAVKTYTSLIRLTRTPGTKLNKSWGHVRASNLGKAYWNLKDDAMWVDVLEQILADESHHRDVNHAFADMQKSDPNPFIAKKMEDLEKTQHRPTLFKDDKVFGA